MKEKYIYPCIIYEEDGIYYANFKDFDACFTDGESIEEVIINAKDVLEGTIFSLLKNNLEVPEPTLTKPSLEDNERLKAVEIDIFELLLESMRNDNILDMAFEIEEKKGTKFLYEKLKKSFNTEIIMKYISEKTRGKNFLILTGVGKIFPIVRTHTILNNLQNIFDHTKVLLFFPGEYTSTDLRLFGFEDNNYYRAFKI